MCLGLIEKPGRNAVELRGVHRQGYLVAQRLPAKAVRHGATVLGGFSVHEGTNIFIKLWGTGDILP